MVTLLKIGGTQLRFKKKHLLKFKLTNIFMFLNALICSHLFFNKALFFLHCITFFLQQGVLMNGPQCQPNQTYCTAGESLLTSSAGLWARAQAFHKGLMKT